MSTVAVITPTTGLPHLRQCIESVAQQTYRDTRHVVVIDGKKREKAAVAILEAADFDGQVIVLPEATGENHYHGHRIYAAVPFLLDSDHVAFLDEDNHYTPDHIESLISLIENKRLDWAYSLRNIITNDGDFLIQDNCQSLGWWPAFDGVYQHIDTSCYLLRRPLAVASSGLWNRKGYTSGVRDPDRELCRWLIYNHPQFFTTGQHTMNYRLGASTQEFQRSFFELGNMISKTIYKIFPWHASTIDTTAAEDNHLVLMPKQIPEMQPVLDALSKWRESAGPFRGAS